MFEFSLHCLTQLESRGISKELVIWVIENATEIYIQDGVNIYQSEIVVNNKNYLVRIFVNENKIPPLIITAYKTSKLKKY